jgi:hypothetical protein
MCNNLHCVMNSGRRIPDGQHIVPTLGFHPGMGKSCRGWSHPTFCLHAFLPAGALKDAINEAQDKTQDIPLPRWVCAGLLISSICLPNTS